MADMRELREERCRRKMQKALQHVEMTKCKTSMQIAKVGHELVEDRRTDARVICVGLLGAMASQPPRRVGNLHERANTN